MKKKKWLNSKIIFTITMVFVVCCFMWTSLWADYPLSWGDNYHLHISGVEVADLDNSSGKDEDGYGDYTNLTAHLTQGKEFSLSLETTSQLGLPRWWKVWIDYNGDEDFDDEGEEVFSAYRSYFVTGCITVPCCTIIGNTRMRVSMASNLPPHTGDIGSGEVEDYTVNITSNYVGNTNIFPYTSTSDNRRAMPFTMPENGRICSVTMYHNGGSGEMILGVYDSVSTPTTRLAETPCTPVSANAGWQTICLTNPVWVAEGHTIWLAWCYESNPGIRYQSGTPGRAEGDACPDECVSLPDPFGSSTIAPYIYSIYATYHRCGCD